MDQAVLSHASPSAKSTAAEASNETELAAIQTDLIGSDKLEQPGNDSQLTENYRSFIGVLQRRGFRGEIQHDRATRTVLATDNSIYEQAPQAVLYPRDVEDLALLATLLEDEAYRAICLSARGGGTGTNGQSLTHGIIVDTSRHMNRILEINTDEAWAYVECGVVKDQLNAELEKRGFFFAPELSTSNRATIGGMISTDASGQGSVIYGKTRDHVLTLESVLLGGELLETKPLDAQQERRSFEESQEPDATRGAKAHQLAAAIEREHGATIERIFPPLNRCLTGYDLAHLRDKDGRLNLSSVLCGSEGSLALLARAKLRILPIPQFQSLLVVYYEDFMSSLRDARALMALKPSSIETIDSKVLMLAMKDFVWTNVSELLPGADPETVKGMNFVEISSHAEDEHQQRLAAMEAALGKNSDDSADKPGRLRFSRVDGKSAVDRIWAMRKRAVGLLGNAKGEARPIAFVEDTAVPPEKLADFIAEFRAILDGHHLDYGMFGHVDAGVLHVRPALDMKDAQQEALAWQISDQVADLTARFGGLMWGEHGKGVRSSYSPQFFGELYPVLQQIKAVFDPYNQLNPGKIATPSSDYELADIKTYPTRGQADRLISSDLWADYNDAVHCNGNGACHNWQPDDPMCPSWKGTRDRRYTPKARAMLVKQWLRDLSVSGDKSAHDPYRRRLVFSARKLGLKALSWFRKDQGFSAEIYDSMAQCLACKSCTGQCPIKVDVPEFRARFLSVYHQSRRRPLKDHLVGSLEALLPVAARLPSLYNTLMQAELPAWAIKHVTGFVDAPAIDSSFRELDEIPLADERKLASLSLGEKARAVVIVEDAFYRYFSPKVVRDLALLLKAVGLSPYRLPFTPNGKPLHVHGFLRRFARTARKTADKLRKIQELGIDLCGVDPSMTLTFRNEYRKVLGNKEAPKVLLVQELLAMKLREDIAALPEVTPAQSLGSEAVLLPHCNEQTIANESLADWHYIFEEAGLNLVIKRTGCCGMAGTFGHEARNRSLSATIYKLSWQGQLADANSSCSQTVYLATGYSCSSQAKRESGLSLRHPVSYLYANLTGR